LRDTACDALRDGRIQCCIEEYSEGWRDLVWDGGIQCGMNESRRYGGIKWGIQGYGVGWRNAMWDGEIQWMIRDTGGDAMRDGGIQYGMEKYSEGCRNLAWDGGIQWGMKEQGIVLSMGKITIKTLNPKCVQNSNLQHCFTTPNRKPRRGGGLGQIYTCRQVPFHDNFE
jgi:hypothetical protein